MKKSFNEMSDLEKMLHNERYILKVHQEALAKMENDGTSYMVQLTIKKAIAASENFIAELEKGI